MKIREIREEIKEKKRRLKIVKYQLSRIGVEYYPKDMMEELFPEQKINHDSMRNTWNERNRLEENLILLEKLPDEMAKAIKLAKRNIKVLA